MSSWTRATGLRRGGRKPSSPRWRTCAPVHSARPGRHGGRKEIGPLVAWLASLGEDSPIYRLVQPEVAEHWVAAGISARTPVLSSSATPMTMTLGAAAQRLRRSTSAVRGLLADFGGNEDPDGRGGGKGAPLHLSRLQVEVVAGQLDDLRDKRRLAAEFGCGRRLLDAIVTAGLLTPASGPAAKHGRPEALAGVGGGGAGHTAGGLRRGQGRAGGQPSQGQPEPAAGGPWRGGMRPGTP